MYDYFNLKLNELKNNNLIVSIVVIGIDCFLFCAVHALIFLNKIDKSISAILTDPLPHGHCRSLGVKDPIDDGHLAVVKSGMLDEMALQKANMAAVAAGLVDEEDIQRCRLWVPIDWQVPDPHQHLLLNLDSTNGVEFTRPAPAWHLDANQL